MIQRIEIQNCPCCKGKELKAYLQVKDHLLSKETFSLKQCVNCTFVFTANPPSEEASGKYYESDDYIEHSDTKSGLINRIYHIARQRMLSKKHRMISKTQKSGSRLLDIGSASGYFLSFMKSKGFQVEGVEISEKARALCLSKFEIEASTPDQFSQGGVLGTFNAITMWHVLEHVYPLSEYLIQIHKQLAENGRVYIAVPNHTSFDAQQYKSDWAAYDVPRHLWHFNPKSFETLIHRHDFELEEMLRLPLDSFYISLVSEQYKNDHTRFSLKALVNGFRSWLKSLSSAGNCSSIVYIIKKSRA